MPQKQKLSIEKKIEIIQDYLKGRVGMSEAARRGGVSKETIRQWVCNYEADGAEAFLSHKNRVYSPRLKQQAVEEYLSGRESQLDICKKYHIRKQTQLRKWIQVYNTHGDFNSAKHSGGRSHMKQGRENTLEERIQIIRECIACGKNYGEMALKYRVSYQQVRSWTLRFEQMGEAGLEDRRGRRKKDQTPRTELEKAQIKIEQLKHKLYLAEMENALLKKLDEIERRCFSEVRQRHLYRAIRQCHKERGCSIEAACELLHVARSAYHKWTSGKLSNRAVENERLAEKIERIHMEIPDKGYRRLNDDLRHDYGIHVNDKRVLRICRARDIRSTVKYSNHGCTRQARNPQYLAKNLLDRQFYADRPNEKWLTDVTEFKWYEGIEVHKLYLSAILDLCDRRIVAYALSERNDNPLVFKTFDMVVKFNTDARPLFHSDRGYQYTSRAFHQKLVQAGMVHSMSPVAHCIDNGPMEGFWGILKRERYYGRRFTRKQELVQMIVSYIRYYNTRRVQRNLGVMTPMEKHALCLAA